MKTSEAFSITQGLAALADPDLADIRRSACKAVEAAHEESPRVFCHVFHEPGFICIAQDFEELDDPFQLGILLHEFGHLATESEKENHADAWVRETLGIPLEYRETLEWVPIEEVQESYRRLVP